MNPSLAAAGFAALTLVYVLIKHFTRPSLSQIRGPKSPSFFLGNLIELFQRPVGQADFEWQRLYGDVVRFKTIFGASAVDQLLIADPKALQRILNTLPYSYPKQPNHLVVVRMVNGRGVNSVDGDDHKRHRKILLPGFGAPEAKAFSNIFRGCAESLCTKWLEIIESSGEQKVVINVTEWISRATLDAIGQAAFDVQFNTINNDDHPLAIKYNNMMSDVFGRLSTQLIFMQAASKYVPIWVLEWLSDHGSHPRFVRAREAKGIVTEVARNLVREKAEMLLARKGSRDLFTLLVKANMDAEAKDKLTEEELISQMRTILFAGHETTSTSLSWILLELARHPEIQSRLRAEIRGVEDVIQARGGTEFTAADLDAMPYLTAVIKEGLRYHCVGPQVHRMAGKDDIIPLSRPITTEMGAVVDEIFVPKGTRIVVSIAAYNRNKELWGEDAHQFNPDRWLKNGFASEKKAVSIGVYSNLMTFLSGPRGCLGWRFAVVEIQVLLVEIIRMFEFTMTDRAERISRQPGEMMIPMVMGELGCGSQVPLTVSVAVRECA